MERLARHVRTLTDLITVIGEYCLHAPLRPYLLPGFVALGQRDYQMRYKNLLLQLSSYPAITSAAAIDHAVRVAELLGARLSAVTFEVDLPVPGPVIAAVMLDVPKLIAQERAKCAAEGRQLLQMLSQSAAQRRVQVDHTIKQTTLSHIPEIVTNYAKLRDLTIIPIGDGTLQPYTAESVIFGSGRPVLLIPDRPGRELSFERIGLAWDFSRPAARALGDALPLLQRAKVVRVVTIIGEKVINETCWKDPLAKHLEYHGIHAVIEEEAASDRTIAEALESYAAARDLDLLVMGAFGHSRIRDFILGGATKSILAKPPLPVFLSH